MAFKNSIGGPGGSGSISTNSIGMGRASGSPVGGYASAKGSCAPGLSNAGDPKPMPKPKAPPASASKLPAEPSTPSKGKRNG